jgi:hypothetical protein
VDEKGPNKGYNGIQREWKNGGQWLIRIGNVSLNLSMHKRLMEAREGTHKHAPQKGSVRTTEEINKGNYLSRGNKP